MSAPSSEQSKRDVDLKSSSQRSTGDDSRLAQTADIEQESAAVMPIIDGLWRYRVQERLGKGGFGGVFKAWDADLARAVAVKLLRPGGKASTAAELLAEARTLARLDHPAIVPVYDLGRTPSDELFIVSKFMDGRDLGNWSQSQTLSPAAAAQLVATIAEALDYAHA